jgi:hypothetical protein
MGGQEKNLEHFEWRDASKSRAEGAPNSKRDGGEARRKLPNFKFSNKPVDSIHMAVTKNVFECWLSCCISKNFVGDYAVNNGPGSTPG